MRTLTNTQADMVKKNKVFYKRKIGNEQRKNVSSGIP